MHPSVKKDLIEKTALSTLSVVISGTIIAGFLLFIPFNDTTLGQVTLLEVITAELGAFSPEEAFLLFMPLVIITAVINAILILQFYPAKQETVPSSRENLMFLATMNMTATLLMWLFLTIVMFFFTLSIFSSMTSLIIFLVLTLVAFATMGALSAFIAHGILQFRRKRKD